MARAVTIGNGNLLVGLDHAGQVRDLYFPYAGHADHVSGASGSYAHRVGVWVDGRLSWLADDSWRISAGCDEIAAMSDIVATNSAIGITLNIQDSVHNEKNVFLRQVTVTNDWDTNREIKIFFAQEFRISESRRGDTAFYDPRVHAIIHYKGHDAFLIHAAINGERFTDYSVGLFDIEGRKGTYADAEDGLLSQNPIEHGSVDSVIGVSFEAHGKESAEVSYWIAAGTTIPEVHRLHAWVLERTPAGLHTSTERYWQAWMNKESRDLSNVEKDIQKLYQRSLAIIRMHTDNRGGIIASSDSDMLNHGRDTYSYVWPRDAAITANALDRAGYQDATQRFFTFMADRLEADGYLMHKYRVDGVLGSSWHPWVRDGVQELPIQEDETALVLFMLYQHYEFAHDLEFIESLYNRFIEPAADFMTGYIEEETGLPSESYDLWEEKYGTATYTAAAVYGALNAASEFSSLLGKRQNAKKYRDRAVLLKKSILTYLYDVPSNMFVKLVEHGRDALRYDKTVDISSLHGVVFFNLLDPFDKKVVNTFRVVEERLRVQTAFNGYMRYEGDRYYRTSEVASPNPWCITTLWMAQYHVRAAKTKQDLRKAYELIRCVHDVATASGVLPEQVHPTTGAHLSTSPLVWSHAEFVITVDEYLKKFKAFG